jgi:hypothetical protein
MWLGFVELRGVLLAREVTGDCAVRDHFLVFKDTLTHHPLFKQRYLNTVSQLGLVLGASFNSCGWVQKGC